MAKHKKVEERLIFGKLPRGYPKFVFRYDDTVNKYSIMNTETKKKTEAFIDEVYLSSKPLKTWTSDYVAVRIGEKYFLCDNNGNCFFESDKPYIICRNVFVSEDGNYIITKKLEKISVIDPDERYFIIEFEEIKFNIGFLCKKLLLLLF